MTAIAAHNHAGRGFARIWILAYALGFFAAFGVELIGSGWTLFWHILVHPKPEAGAFDLLIATVIGVLGVTLALYLSSVLFLVASFDREGLPAFAARLDNWWTLGPAFLLIFWIHVLIASAWGFPRTALALGFSVLVGAVGFLCMIQMVRSAIAPAKGSGKTTGPVDNSGG